MFGTAVDLPILIFFHLILFVFLQSSKQTFSTFDKIGIAWVFLIGLAIIRRVLHLEAAFSSESYFIKFIYYPLGYGPCLYLYARYLTTSSSFQKNDFFHFIPLVLCLPLPLLHWHQVAVSLDSEKSPSLVVIVFVITSFVSLVYYSTGTYNLIKRHNQELFDHFSYQTIRNTLSWLIGFIFLYLTVIIVQSAIILLKSFQISFIFPQSITSLMFFSYFYLVSFFLLRQNSIHMTLELNGNEKREKYAKSGLTSQRLHEIELSLLKYMSSSKLYLKNDLNIDEFAKEVGIPSPHISQVLNQVMGKNFFLFINEYRVQEVISRLNHPDYQGHSILRIALDSGFNSKSSFNSIFRKISGKTPMEYRV